MKIKRVINQRTFKRFKTMCAAAVLILGVQYMSEKSMSDIIDKVTDESNDEYDWALPFVTAQDGFAFKYLEGEEVDGKIMYDTTEGQLKW